MAFSPNTAREFIKTSDSVVARMQETSKKLQDPSSYEPVLQSLKELARGQFPYSTIEVHAFGSRVIGVASDESDLDIFVEIDGSFCSQYLVSQVHDAKYRKLASAVENSRQWLVKERVLRTAVPIIICDYLPMKLNCDINIVNGLSVGNSQLIAHLFSIQPEAVLLYHYVRQWMKVQGLDLFKGYTITLLVIYYLQTKNLMPSVETVQTGVYPKKIISRRTKSLLLRYFQILIIFLQNGKFSLNPVAL